MPDHLRLASDPNFLALFEEGPLAEHIAYLRGRVLSPSTSVEETILLRAQLDGILKVREWVIREAKVEKSSLGDGQPPVSAPRRVTMLPGTLR